MNPEKFSSFESVNEPADPTPEQAEGTERTDADVVKEYESNGWRLVESSAASFMEGMEVTVVGRGDHSLVFERPETEEENLEDQAA